MRDAFLSAVKSGDVQIVRCLIEQSGIDVNARNNDNVGRTPIFYANNVDIMRMLIASGAQVNSKDNFGLTPLHWNACEKGREKNVACCKLLLSNNADIEAESHSGMTPLHLAAKYEQLEVVRLLLAHQRSRHGHECVSSLLVKTDIQCGRNALHFAAFCSSAETARFLMEQCKGEGGVLVPACHQMMLAKYWAGCTPLAMARNRIRNNTEVVEYLESFTRLTLAAPAVASPADDVAVMLNSRLDEFQHAIAAECGESIRTTCCATEVPDVVVYVVLGYLSPLDVMKR